MRMAAGPSGRPPRAGGHARLRLRRSATATGRRLGPASSEQRVLLSQQRDDLVVLLLQPRQDRHDELRWRVGREPLEHPRHHSLSHRRAELSAGAVSSGRDQPRCDHRATDDGGAEREQCSHGFFPPEKGCVQPAVHRPEMAPAALPNTLRLRQRAESSNTSWTRRGMSSRTHGAPGLPTAHARRHAIWA